jgi:hypothetical protein
LNAFEAKHAALLAEDPTAAEDPDEYLAENVRRAGRHLQANAKQPTLMREGVCRLSPELPKSVVRLASLNSYAARITSKIFNTVQGQAFL